ncbi:MAG TPA: c-type cytochrome [Pseudolabrys sp.]|nr:c-type cytochrome [Pseudolabrys sp.]
MHKLAHPIALCGALLILAATAKASEQAFGQIERGRYLVHAADCGGCHTQVEGGQPFAGGRPIETPFGDLVSPNITPDQETGIGAWTDQQFDNAVRRGISPDGDRLYPAMPYNYYTKMTRADVMAIRAYLNTVKAVRNSVKSNTLPFPVDIRAGMRAWDALFFDAGTFQPDRSKSAEWNRGAYLVTGPGHCGACHTPKNTLGADEASHAFEGARLQGWFAPNLTNGKTKGLGEWSVDDIAGYLQTGHNRISAASGPMAEVVDRSTSHLTALDAHAIATYLKSLPGDDTPHTAVADNDPAMRAGQAIYHDQCSACHRLDGKGVDGLFPSLADSALVRSSDPRTAIRFVLRGARSVGTAGAPVASGMPSFAKQLTDQEVADVLTYVRNHFGHPAPAIATDTVADARKQLAARKD